MQHSLSMFQWILICWEFLLSIGFFLIFTFAAQALNALGNSFAFVDFSLRDDFPKWHLDMMCWITIFLCPVFSFLLLVAPCFYLKTGLPMENFYLLCMFHWQPKINKLVKEYFIKYACTSSYGI